jgi:hypothetical protein
MGVLAGSSTAAWSNPVIDPRFIEFIPSAADGRTTRDGRPVVTHYELQIARAATGQIVERIHLGKPAVQADGMVRLEFIKATTSIVDGVTYIATVVANGPAGRTESLATDAFSFSACKYSLSERSKRVDADGGRGTLTVSAGGGLPCKWTVSSSAPWLTVLTGNGTDNGSVSFMASANTTGASRKASLTIGSLSYDVTQSAVASHDVIVSTVEQLQAAIASASSHSTIVLAPGIYRLTAPLHLQGALTDVVIRGATGRHTDVVIDGSTGQAAHGLWISGARAPRIADLTIRRTSGHSILIDAGTQAPRLSNLHLQDSGLSLVMAGKGVNDGVLEASLLEFTQSDVQASAGGVEMRGVARWTVRGNAFLNMGAPSGLAARPAVSANAASLATTIERNRFMNCQIGIALGAAPAANATEHQGGLIANNFFYRGAAVAGGPGIVVADSPATRVVYNTIIVSGTYPSAIEYRYPRTTELVVANNLLDGAIKAIDGAWGLELGNVANATPDLFVNPSAGDLHLKPTASVAIDVANVSILVPTDIDGQSRPFGLGPDVGADEAAPAETDGSPNR